MLLKSYFIAWRNLPSDTVSSFVLSVSVSGTRFGCRNLEESGCSLYWYCRQKPSGTKGENITLKSMQRPSQHLAFILTCHLIHVVYCGGGVCWGTFAIFLQDYKPEEDPCKFKSVKTGRGPLGPDWKVQLFWCKHLSRQRHIFQPL